MVSPAANGEAPSHATRPAEVFARSVDWFVAVSLARDGRINGYLSSVQDDLLTGYGTVTSPDPTGATGQALMAVLDEVAPVYPETRRWFLESYGRVRAPTAYDLARRILEAPLGAEPALILDRRREPVEADEPEPDESPETGPGLTWLTGTMERLDRLEAERESVLAAVSRTCRPLGYEDRGASARRALVEAVTRARARGIVVRLADRLAGADGPAWAEARLDGRKHTAAVDSLAADALTPLLERVSAIGDARVGTDALAVPSSPAECGPNAFLAD
jgi:hypothetical protein